jgi:class 3 adenylate cyclase
MSTPTTKPEYIAEMRLFLEEVSCNLCRFQHVTDEGVAPENVRIDVECHLGQPNSFADIRVQALEKPAYFVEVKYGYSAERMLSSLARKYGPGSPGAQEASKLILVIDAQNHANWAEVEERIKGVLRPGLELEVWNEQRLLQLIAQRFGLELGTVSAAKLLDVRDAISAAEKRYVLGDQSKYDAMEEALHWHFGFWRLKQLRDSTKADRRSLYPPGRYRDAVIVMADLCGFSGYVRDTREEGVVRACLTSFCTKCRHQIINAGGMFYQFLGDAVMAMFGVPDFRTGYVQAAFDCAKCLAQIGDSVSNEWQRQIDRIQPNGGAHIGIAMGDVEVLSLRPFSRTHMGVVGDSMNMTARLVNSAGSGEIVVSNTFYQKLDEVWQRSFQELEAVEAKNVGLIRAWKWSREVYRGG